MAKKDTEPEKVEQESAPERVSAVENAEDEPATERLREPVAARAVKKQTPWLWIVIAAGGTVLIVAVMAIGWMRIESLQRSAMHAERYDMQQGATRFGGGRQGFYGNSSGSPRRQSRPTLSGVVTALNGDSITVSGGGKQVTVKKTDSTTINGDATSVAVNDTVSVYGTTASDGTVTATRIVIRNAASPSASSDDTTVPSV